MASFDAHSSDSMFAKIIARLDTQDRTLNSILEQTQKTNGRTIKLEQESFANKRVMLLLSAVISAVISMFTAWLGHR